MGEDKNQRHLKDRELPQHWQCQNHVLQERIHGLLHVGINSSLSHVFTFFSRTVYNLSTLKHDTVQQQLYQKYTESINVYLQQNILPELQKLHNDDLLEALGRKWANHEVMVRWMQRFFQYLDRFYVEINSLTPLTD